MKVFKIKRNDTGPALRATLKTDSGDLVALSDLNEIKFIMREVFYYKKSQEQVKVENSSNINLLDQNDLCTKGGFEYHWDEADTDCAGNYRGEFQITTNGVESSGYGPFELADGQTLIFSIDEGSSQTITFNTADFVDILEATAEEIVAKINAGISGGLASVSEYTRILLQTNNTDVGGSVRIIGGTANDVIRLKAGFYKTQRITLPESGLKIEVLEDLEEN